MTSRVPVVGRRWSVSCDHPLASKIGAGVLEDGGNAADAAVAMAAGLAVLQPYSMGLGGDCFCLFYSAKDKTVYGLNASGQSPANLTLDLVESKGYNAHRPFPSTSPLSVMVPGAPAGFVDVREIFGSGKLSLKDLLNPAISLAEEGFPVSCRSADCWHLEKEKLMSSRNGSDFLLGGRPPSEGEILSFPKMAAVLKELAAHGKEGFYTGRVARAVASAVQEAGGCLAYEDLLHYGSMPPNRVDPLAIEYRGVAKVWYLPPNCAGLVGLLALNILEGFDLQGMGQNSVSYLHAVLECLRLAFADAFDIVSDPRMLRDFDFDALLSKGYAARRRELFCPDKAFQGSFSAGHRSLGRDTTYMTAVDGHGNACSFMATCCNCFGSGIVPDGCGFALTDRALSFSLERGHRNALGPSKKSLHTNIPTMVTDCHKGELLTSMGSTGFFLQPQTQVQILLNMLEFGMNPQEALDSPRTALVPYFPETLSFFNYGTTIALEEGFPECVVSGLEGKGYIVNKETPFSKFGKAHVITKGDWWRRGGAKSSSVLWTGCDSRSDGIAISW